ncbi:MAG: hypothetical protein HOC77_13805 [Chloroflexi bacterium]|nr:hypothetical protein [Chloroflexota bacterium]MBT4072160.1 hypothetical protein [Chloroflexota bacterium]MBT4516150.1 hypothetical protein [Chloroflexota bacterium]MBT5318994.1 hypothetical protein [Chloroflexota bacterium]MBT6682875.1 hypothetical protein [Chloroflexota bacterium]
MQRFWKESRLVDAVRWFEGDPFIGPMRFDLDAPEFGPYLDLFGKHIRVHSGDWVVHEDLLFYATPDTVFEESFDPVWDWSTMESMD